MNVTGLIHYIEMAIRSRKLLFDLFYNMFYNYF